MKKNPFLIYKKIIVVDNQIEAIKGGKASGGHTDCSVGVSCGCPKSLQPICPDPNDTCTDGPDCDNSGG